MEAMRIISQKSGLLRDRGWRLRSRRSGSFHLLAKQVLCRFLRVMQYAIRKNSKIESSCNAERQSQSQSEWNRSDWHRFSRLSHVHHYDDAEVIVRPNCAVDDADDREPYQVRLQGGTEDIELGEESARHRNTNQGQEKNR